MNAIEERLRDAYRAAAQTIPPEAVGTLARRPRPRPRPRRFLVPAAATVAVLAVAGLVTVVARNAPPARRPMPAASATPVSLGPVTLSARPSRYFVAFENNGQGSVYDPLAVYSARTGRLVAALSTPRSAVQPNAAVALGDGRTFIVADTEGPSNKAVCAGTTRLYRLRLAADGQPASLDPLALPAIAGYVDTLTATPDGGTIGYDSLVCDLPLYGTSVIGVVNTATGKVRQWTWRKPGVLASSLSLSADGRSLTYLWSRNEVVTRYEGRTLAPWTISQLPAAAAAGRASAVSRSLISGSGTLPTPVRYQAALGRTLRYLPAAVTADGRTLYYCVQVPDKSAASSPAGYGMMAVREYHAATRATTTVHTFSGRGYCYLSMSGGQLLVGVVNGANIPRTSIFRLDPRSDAVTSVGDPRNVNPVTW
ncbi:MAG TPA: hypothetical protein VMA72_15995 [Streptosporangiaceae bacterium]|nr:hypothetical protein [Streptosporangiaceae bacterium]